jgi:hypothetical protein
VIVEERIYTLIPGHRFAVDQLYAEEGYPVLGEAEDKLIGYFHTDIGTLNQLVHLWRFEDHADRDAHWARLRAKPEWVSFVKKLFGHIQHQENRILVPASFGKQP